MGILAGFALESWTVCRLPDNRIRVKQRANVLPGEADR